MRIMVGWVVVCVMGTAMAQGRTRAVFLHYFRGKLTERRELAVVVR